MLALQRALGSDDTVGELVTMVNESDRSELEKGLAIWRLYSSNNMRDEALATLATLMPAYKAARLSPVDGLTGRRSKRKK